LEQSNNYWGKKEILENRWECIFFQYYQYIGKRKTAGDTLTPEVSSQICPFIVSFRLGLILLAGHTKGVFGSAVDS
jgi:hypothetical protein